MRTAGQPFTGTQESAYQRLMDTTIGFRWKWSALVQAVQLNIADLLADGPTHVDELARKTQADPRSLHLLLQFLAYGEIFEETTPGCFAQTDQSYFLQADVPGSVRNLVLMEASVWHRSAWDALGFTIQTGRSALEQTQSGTIWRYFATHPEEKQVFDAAMLELSRIFDGELATAYDFASATTIVDLGGGRGSFLTTLLQTYLHLHGTLFDLAPTVAAASEVLRQANVADRCTALAGDLFEALPPGADLYVLKQVLHGWDDASALAILRRCRQAMRPDSRLLIAEMFPNPQANNLPPGGYPPFVGYQSLQMLAVFGGRERNNDEFQRLLEQADLHCVETRRTRSPYRLLVCEPR